MFKHRIKFFLAVPILVIVMLCAPNIATAIPITDTFFDIVGQGADPGNIILIDEHGGPDPLWAAGDSGIDLIANYVYGTNQDLRVNIENTSSHTMWNTVLVFEQDFFIDWKSSVLEPDTWDGVDSNGNAAYWFGDIAPGEISWITIDVIYGEAGYSPMGLGYDSIGLDSSGFDPFSTVSVAHGAVVPEPASLILFIAGGAVLAGRKYFKRK